MELLDNYLKAIRSYLPETQRDDIIRELSEDIRSKIEDKEGELGRPLNEAEIEAILRAYGHPMIVAGRYRQDERSFAFGKQLIGPVLFPFYTKVLSFNLGITSVVLVVVFAVLIASGQRLSLLSALPTVFFYQLLIQFAVVTIIFTAVDKQLTRHPDRWDPRKPKHGYYPNLVVTQDAASVPRIESVSRLIGLAIMIVWLRVLQQEPFLMLGPAAAYLKLAPVWHQLYLPVVLLTFVGMAQAAINLFRTDWVRLRSATRIFMGAAGFAMWCFLLKMGPWVIPGDTAATLSGVSLRTLEIINRSLYYVLLAAAIISAMQLLRDLWRLARGTNHHVPSRA